MHGFREILQTLCRYELCTLDLAKIYWQELIDTAQDMTEDEAENEIKRIQGESQTPR